MHLKGIITVFIFILFWACHSGKENTPTASEPAKSSDEKNMSIKCYRYASPTDTIALTVVHAGDSITGNLVYNLSGKDKNSGTIVGKMNGDILVAEYTFNAERMSSTLEVAFKLVDGKFIEGYGDVDVQDNHVRFKDIHNLTFNNAFRLVEIPCP